MPRSTKTFDLEEEKRRIDQRLDNLADQEAEDSRAEEKEGERPSTPKFERQDRREEAQRLQQMLVGVEWALDPDEQEGIDPIGEVTLGSLNAAEYAQVADFVSNDMSSVTDTYGERANTENTRRIIFASGGVVEAPFLDDDERKTLENKIKQVRELAPQFVYWLEQRADELTTPKVEGNGFVRRVGEKCRQKRRVRLRQSSPDAIRPRPIRD